MVQAGGRRVNSAKSLVALGSNVTSYFGTPVETVKAALRAMNDGPTRLIAQSRLYLTPFIPAGTGPDVVNAVALIETRLTPVALLQHLHGIEAEFDRRRETRWGARTLDLDLLSMDDLVLPDQRAFRRWQELAPEAQKAQAPEGLVLPHPRLQDRGFVLMPAAEVAPDWRHPVLGLSITEMLVALPAEALDGIAAIEG
ncbi:MAG: 2-amino-4-hydroxy-6-hydroxymethyldihydropteridine diphosphokinase [Maritimibacter sp.]|nr:2-amino-4-hydroxy-6-hydroxymethyldihydropteridine diphosphokinase [Maritimibacter sp.]